MATAHTKLFKSNQSQAVRLPKAVSFPASVKEVDVISIGNKRLIIPTGESWDSWFDGTDVTDDFMASRNQPEDQDREEI
ncbi:MAG: type II toxin-antitoxin system VapB family antitoxin [Candidatus Scalindua sp.]